MKTLFGILKTWLRDPKRHALEITTIPITVVIFLFVLYLAIVHIWEYRHGETFKLMLDVGGLFGGSIVLIAIYTAIRAERINQRLIETQMVSGDVVTGFPEVFERHLMRYFINHETGSDNLEKVELVLSTPAFGLNPLGPVQSLRLVNSLRLFTQKLEVVLFTPDAHYSHFMNTLLWQQRSDTHAATLWELAFCADSFIEALKQGTGSKGWHIWPTNNSDKRVLHFQTATDSRLYLVLSDEVKMQSDLKQFSGRSLPLPSILREPVVGGDMSIFGKYKVCPITGKMGTDAALTTTGVDEFSLLLTDYLLCRTSQIVQTFTTFSSDIHQTLIKLPLGDENPINYILKTTQLLLQYFNDVGLNKKTNYPTGSESIIGVHLESDEESRIKTLVGLRTMIAEMANMTISTFQKLFSELEKLTNEAIKIDRVKGLQETDCTKQITIDHAILILYLIIRSGMEKSEYVKRQQKKVT